MNDPLMAPECFASASSVTSAHNLEAVGSGVLADMIINSSIEVTSSLVIRGDLSGVDRADIALSWFPKDQLEKQFPVNPDDPDAQKRKIENIQNLKQNAKYKDRIVD